MYSVYFYLCAIKMRRVQVVTVCTYCLLSRREYCHHYHVTWFCPSNTWHDGDHCYRCIAWWTVMRNCLDNEQGFVCGEEERAFLAGRCSLFYRPRSHGPASTQLTESPAITSSHASEAFDGTSQETQWCCVHWKVTRCWPPATNVYRQLPQIKTTQSRPH